MLDVAAMRATPAALHPAGHPFILGGVAVAAVGLPPRHPLTWLGVLFALFCAFFATRSG